jgi:hypothetical protein
LLVNLSLPSGVRRRPDRPHWAERVQRNEACLDVIAPGAFEQSAFETNRPRRNAFQHHPRLTTRTARALVFGLQPQRDFVLRIGVALGKTLLMASQIFQVDERFHGNLP